MIKLLIPFLLISCHFFERDNSAKPSQSKRLGELKDKLKLYIDLSYEELDSDGWITANHCDALLHTSLLVTGGGSDYGNLFAARDEDGRWWRRPARDCLKKGESKSSISRDMLLGLLHAIVTFKDQEAAEDLLDYAEENNWVMGEHDGSLDGRNRVLLTPSFVRLLEDARAYTRNSLDSRPESDEENETAPYEIVGANVRFTDHLDALVISLRGEMYGAITDYELGLINQDKNADPNNALYHYIFSRFSDGDQTKAVDILLREDLFPKDRLPKESDRCAEYLWMHGEKDKDWKPCDKGNLNHPGHDFIFVASKILKQ